jgi:hypothetical protein
MNPQKIHDVNKINYQNSQNTRVFHNEGNFIVSSVQGGNGFGQLINNPVYIPMPGQIIHNFQQPPVQTKVPYYSRTRNYSLNERNKENIDPSVRN